MTSAVIQDNLLDTGSWSGAALDESKNVSIKNNRITGMSQDAILLSNTDRTIVSGNYLHNNTQSGLEIYNGSNATIVYNNVMFKNSEGIYYNASIGGLNGQIIVGNKIFGNDSEGIQQDTGNSVYMAGNQVYANVTDGYQVTNNTGIITAYDSYGVKAANTTTDIDFADTTGSQISGYATTLGSSTEIPADDVSVSTAYFASFKHDATGGTTKIWGEYSIPADTSETPQTESTQKFNYADATFPDGFSPHIYNGSGTEDPTGLAFAFNGGSLGAGAVTW